VTSTVSLNVIVNTPVPSFSADEENVGFTESVVRKMGLSAAGLIVLPVWSCTAAASMSSCGVVNAMTV